jgi:hypothetical protein
MVPWPVLNQRVGMYNLNITVDAVQEYLYVLYDLPQNSFVSMEDYVKDNIDRWDYHRMDAKVFGRVPGGERMRVEDGVIRVGAGTRFC